MNILNHFLNFNSCRSFICILCSKHRKTIVLEILNDCKGVDGFFTIENIESNLIEINSQLNLNDGNIGKILEKSFSNINFNDNYVLERLDYEIDRKYFKEDRFQLFLYVMFLMCEDTTDSSNTNNLHYNFKLKGFKVENVISQWCSNYMETNDTPVFKALVKFFQYGGDHYIKLSSKARSRFLEKALRNLNKEGIEIIRGTVKSVVFTPIDTDEEGIKRIYRELSSTIN